MCFIDECDICVFFFNVFCKEVFDLNFLFGFVDFDFDWLDFFGWIDLKMLWCVYVVIWVDDVFVGVFL